MFTPSLTLPINLNTHPLNLPQEPLPKNPPKQQQQSRQNPNLNLLPKPHLLLHPFILPTPPLRHLPRDLRKISHNPINPLPNTPAHQITFINRPRINRPPLPLRLFDKPPPQRPHDHFLADIKPDIGIRNPEDLPRIAYIEADNRDRHAREISLARGNIGRRPDAQDETTRPGSTTSNRGEIVGDFLHD